MQNFFWALFGVTFGIIMGAIPGLSDNMAIVLLLPFTYYLGPIPGIAMLMGLSKGANFGGSIPAILFNIPGTPQAMITTFDGYPLAKNGKSGKALKTALLPPSPPTPQATSCSYSWRLPSPPSLCA